MIIDCKELREFERDLIINTKVDYNENFRMVDEMYLEALELGVFPLKDLLSDMERKTRIARVLNCV